MQYSPKLKKAMEEMKHIFSKYDIGGVVILHTPGHAEFLNVLETSYSCVRVNGDEVRFKAKLADFNGDKAAHLKVTTDSLNMLQSIVEVGGHVILPLMDLTERLERDLNAESNKGNITSHRSQNN